MGCLFCAALILPDELSPNTEAFFSDLAEEDSLTVPALWWYEIANVLTIPLRRKRLSASDLDETISLLQALGIETDYSTGQLYMREILELSDKHELSAYDAAYLELAIRNRSPLATLDQNLKSVAKTAGIRVY